MIFEIEHKNNFCVRVFENIKKSAFCKKYNLSYSCVVSNNDDFKKGDRVIIINKKLRVHIVKPTETIKSISLKYGVLEEQILAQNNIKNIFVGQQLLI